MTALTGFNVPGAPQYRRLFGTLTPAQVMLSVTPLRPLGRDSTGGFPAAHCDPSQQESESLYSVLASIGHPSAASLASIAALRARHVAKGHTPQADASHGPVFWMRGVRQWWEKAIAARLPDNRRKALIAAASMLVAMIDAEDFTARQQEPQDAPDE